MASVEDYPRYRVEITRAESGDAVWASDELIERGSELSLDLPRSLFAAASYEVRIYGLSESAPDVVAELLEEYAIGIDFR